jgi:hypothetical protein
MESDDENTKARRPISEEDRATGLDPGSEQFHLMLGRNLGSRLCSARPAGS